MATTWITFYSYKGGVGRSMAVANVAGELTRRGRKVVIIDFDLEAPGLDSFNEFRSAKNRGNEGVVDYVHQFIETKETPPIAKFLHECTEIKTSGKLWIMPSGRKDPHYARKLHSISWRQLYKDNIAQPLVEDWKSAIEKEVRPDYVLIDSRTGLTDVGGICTLHFPDVVVLIFALNNQNIEGTSGVFSAISKQSARKPIQIVTVASPVPNLDEQTSHTLRDRLRNAKEHVGGQISASIRYFPPVALKERIWTLSENERSPIARDYGILTDKITNIASDGIDFLISRAKEIQSNGDQAAAFSVIDALWTDYRDRADAFKAIADLKRFLGDAEGAKDALLEAIKITPTDLQTFTRLIAYFHLRKEEKQLSHFLEEMELRLSRLSDDIGKDIWPLIGAEWLYLEQPKRAFHIYTNIVGGNPDSLKNISTVFNYAESRRRASKKIYPSDWERVLAAKDTSLEGYPIHWVANRLQAMHVPYAVTGNIQIAEEHLDRAIATASQLNRTALIFSLATYENVNVEDFVSHTRTMLLALKSGRLWDGMRLP